MERYFNGEEFSVEEIRSAMRTEVMDGDIVPVAMGSNIQAQGVANLLSDIVRFFPSPDKRTCAGINRTTNDIFEANYEFRESKNSICIQDNGRSVYRKVFFCKGMLGEYSKAMTFFIMRIQMLRRNRENFIRCAAINRRKYRSCLPAISEQSQNYKYTYGRYAFYKATQVTYARTDYSVPYTYMRYKVKNKGDEDKVSQALARMTAEDVTLKAVNDSENRQTLLYGMGDQHLEIVASKLAARYKVEITLETPKVAFRETIRKNSDVDTKYKKQSGGHGQYGHVKMRFEPSGDLETPYVFEECVVGGAVPKNYFPRQ